MIEPLQGAQCILANCKDLMFMLGDHSENIRSFSITITKVMGDNNKINIVLK